MPPPPAHLPPHDIRAVWFVMGMAGVPKGQHDYVYIKSLYWTTLLSSYGAISFGVGGISLTKGCRAGVGWGNGPRVDSQRNYNRVWACSPFHTHPPLLVVRHYSVFRREKPAFLCLGWKRKWVRKQRETKHEMWAGAWFLSTVARHCYVGCGELWSTFWIGFENIMNLQ